jgi:hypothetical protein
MAQYNFDQMAFKETPTRVPDSVDEVGAELKKLRKDYKHIGGLKTYLSLWHKMRSSVYLRMGYKKACFKEAMLSLRYNPLNYKVYAYLILNVLGIYKRI